MTVTLPTPKVGRNEVMTSRSYIIQWDWINTRAQEEHSVLREEILQVLSTFTVSVVLGGCRGSQGIGP